MSIPRDPASAKMDTLREQDFQKLSPLFQQAMKTGNFNEYNKELEATLKQEGVHLTPTTQIKPQTISPMTSWQYLVYLNTPCQGQINSYYCGPASSVQLLLFKGITHYPGNTYIHTNQPTLASYLGTTNQTPFGNNWTNTLVAWDNYVKYWTLQWTPSATNLTNYTYDDVYYQWPLIYDTHMCVANGYLPEYLPRYYGNEYWHYVTGDGLGEDTNYTWWVHYTNPDDIHIGTLGAFMATASNAASVLRDRGIVW